MRTRNLISEGPRGCSLIELPESISLAGTGSLLLPDNLSLLDALSLLDNLDWLCPVSFDRNTCVRMKLLHTQAWGEIALVCVRSETRHVYKHAATKPRVAT
jgi:hypothetical protein